MRGATLDGVHVEAAGPTPRMGETSGGGQLTLSGLQAGTYRVKFSGDAVTTYERDITLTAGKPTRTDIILNPAPPPKEIVRTVEVPVPAAAPTSAAASVIGPTGQTQVLSLVDLAEKELDRRPPGRESLVACSGNTRSTLVLLSQEQPARLYGEAESVFYVIAGEGTLRIKETETKLEAGSFVSLPRATNFALARRGRNPLVLLSILSGEPCEEAK